MSDFQLALLAIGAAVIAGVVAYNKWQEVKFRRNSERAFGAPRADVLVDRVATPPTNAEPAPQFVESKSAPGEPIEHTLSEPAPGPSGEAEKKGEAPPLRATALDPAVDYIAELACPRPVSGATLAQHAQALVDEGLLKPIHWEAYDAGRGSWHPIALEAQYERIRVGLQLTNRAGPVTDDDLLAFCGSLHEVALALAADVDFADVGEAVRRARDLERFCNEVDVQIGLSVIGSDAHTFSGSKIRALAESAGLSIGRDGRFHRTAEDGNELFSLSNIEPMPFHPETIKTLQTRGVTVLFDVPRVPDNAAPFRRFIEFAHQLEHALDGVLVDDNNKPIGQAALETISQQLDQIHKTMLASGVRAGSPLAQRLFS
jgi:ZipA, C-terminal FtsZ-binding domain